MSRYVETTRNFDIEIAGQSILDISFEWQQKTITGSKRIGLEFRDRYGRLIFAISTIGEANIYYSTNGIDAESSIAIDALNPRWHRIFMNQPIKTFDVCIHVDFIKKIISYFIMDKNGTILVKQENVFIKATCLAKMSMCYYIADGDQTSQIINNFKVSGQGNEVEHILKQRTIYAFGDSIIAGHQYKKGSFIDFVAAQEGMILTKYAVNGATILDASYDGGQILKQLDKAPSRQPDFIVLDGGTNDAEYLCSNSCVEYGQVTLSKQDAFDTNTFAGMLEKTIFEIRKKWPDAICIFVIVHKLGSRDNQIQMKFKEIVLKVCSKWDIAAANLYDNTSLDTNDNVQKLKYSFDDNGLNGLPGIGGTGTHPNFAAIEEFYVPIVADALRRGHGH